MSSIYSTTGPILRTYPKMRVLRGYDPTRPSTLQKSAPVAASVTAGIFSGQVISLSWNVTLLRFEWILGGSGTQPVYFANGDSVDPDIISADSLPALPCFEQYVLQTGYYDAGTYNHGTQLTFSTGTPGNVAVRAGTVALIGIADGVNGSSNSAIVNLASPTTDAGYAAYAPYDSSASNLSVLQFSTSYNAAVA